MVTDPSLLLNVAYQRQQEMLEQAEAERLYKQLKRNRPRLFQQASHHLADVVRQSRGRSQSNPATLIFSEKYPTQRKGRI